MVLNEAIEGFVVLRFCKASKIRSNHIYSGDFNYSELTPSYKLGIKKSIECIYDCYNRINAYIEDRRVLFGNDVAIFIEIIKDCQIRIDYFIEFCNLPKSFYTSRHTSVENIDDYTHKIKHGLVKILNRLLDYANSVLYS